jgi:hypothetical protein
VSRMFLISSRPFSLLLFHDAEREVKKEQIDPIQATYDLSSNTET